MGGRRIFLYANQPVVRIGNHYYAKFRNFVDFLGELARCDVSYRLIVPCQIRTGPQDYENDLVALDLPGDVVELTYYEGGKDFQAFMTSFINALRACRLVRRQAATGVDTVFAGGSPSAFSFWFSLIVPANVRFAFFVRGDAVESMRGAYRGKLLYYPAVWAEQLFRWRLCRLLKNGRAQAFTFGDKLTQYYAKYHEGNAHTIAPLISEDFVRRGPRPMIPSDGPLRVLYVGRLSGEKNVMGLLDACKIAREQGSPFMLTIVGLGPLASGVERFIRESGISDYARQLGHIPNGASLIDQFDSHDLLCLPSFTEGTPRVVIEAFARKMPVVATRAGGVPYLFPGAIKFIEGFESSDIARAIAWCDANREQVSLYGQKGHTMLAPYLISENVRMVDRILRESGPVACPRHETALR